MRAELIHYCGPFSVFAGLTSLCGCAMQHHSGRGFSNKVNYWGLTGIRTEKKMSIVALDWRFVTCDNCLAKKNE